MSVKIHDLFARKAGTSLAEFSTYWTGTHAPIAQRFKQIQHYVQCHRIQERPLVESFAPTWPDGCAETWYVDADALAEMVAAPRFSDLMTDETHFMNLDRPRSLLASHARLVDNKGFDARARGVKLLVFAARHSGLDESAFMSAWSRDDDAALGRTLGASQHIVCTPTAAGILIQTDKAADSTGADARPYDAVRELWWPSLAHFEQARKQHPDTWTALLRLDAIDAARSMTLLSQERVIIA
jgi:EthD domain